LDTGTIIRFPGGNRRKSGTNTRPATIARPSITVGSLAANPSARSISLSSSFPIPSGGAGISARSNTGSPSGCASPAARLAHATKNSTKPWPSLTAWDMHTPRTLPPPFASCVTFAVNTGAPPSMMSIHGS
jgi:hypothetical protein